MNILMKRGKIMNSYEKIVKFEPTLTEIYFTSEITDKIKEYIKETDITYSPSPVIQNNLTNILPIKYSGFLIGYITLNNNIIEKIGLINDSYTKFCINNLNEADKELQNFIGYKISFTS